VEEEEWTVEVVEEEEEVVVAVAEVPEAGGIGDAAGHTYEDVSIRGSTGIMPRNLLDCSGIVEEGAGVDAAEDDGAGEEDAGGEDAAGDVD